MTQKTTISFKCIGSMCISHLAGTRPLWRGSSAGKESRAAQGTLVAIAASIALAACDQPATMSRPAEEVASNAEAGQRVGRAKESTPLIEEVVIGSDEGDSAYPLEYVGGIAVAEDRLFVLDGSKRISIFSLEGEYMGRVGRTGPGPGEYTAARYIAVDAAGNVYVQDRLEIEIFTATGEPVDTWRLHPGARPSWAAELAVSADGTAYVVERRDYVFGKPWMDTHNVTAYRNGVAIETRPMPTLDYDAEGADVVLEIRDRSGGVSRLYERAPFAPRQVFEVSPSGIIVTGVGNDYVVERHFRSGETQVIEEAWEPIAVNPAEAEWHRHRIRAATARAAGASGWSPEDRMPTHKPAFLGFVVDRNDRTWVMRAGAGSPCISGTPNSGSDGAPECWQDTYFADVFDAAGKFLGEVNFPPEFQHRYLKPFKPRPYIKDNMFIAVVADASKNEFVKIYRFELPQDD